MQHIKDQAGRVIGLLHLLDGGTRRVFTTSGQNLGWYEPTTNRTFSTRTSGWIGEGDHTMGLLYEHLKC